MQIWHDGSYSYIKDAGTGDLRIQGSTNVQIWNANLDKQAANFNAAGAQTLYYDNSAKIATTNTGIDVTGNIGVSGTVDGIDIAARDAVLTSTTTTAGAALPKAGGTMTGNLVLGGDDRKITFGTSNDLEIYHSGSDSYIRDVGTGGLRLTGSQIILRNAANSGHMLNAVDGGAVSLYHNTSTRLETTSTGINVTGKIVAGDASSTSGDVLLEGYYGNGATVVIGSERSSGGIVLGYGVHPSTTAQGQFLSSTPVSLKQAAYIVADTHKWYTATSNTAVAVGSQVTTMTERMRIKSDGYVGIGTDNPPYKLVVSNNGASGIEFGPAYSGTTNLVQHYNRATSSYVDVNTSALQHKFYNGATFAAIIDSSGNVGIGTDSPNSLYSTANQLVIGDGSAEVGMTIYTPSSGAGRIFFADGLSGGNQYAAFISYNHADQKMLFGTGSSGGTDLAIDQYGKVGIGTTAPVAKLHIQGAGAYNHTPGQNTTSDFVITSSEMADNNAHSIMQLVSVRQSLSTGSGSTGYLGFSTMDDSNGQGIRDAGRIAIVNETGTSRNSPTALSFWTNAGGTDTTAAVEKMRITSVGNVGIGTATPGDIRLKVHSNDSDDYIAIFKQTHASNLGTVQIDSPADNNARGSRLDFARGGVNKWKTGMVYADTSNGWGLSDATGSGTALEQTRFLVTPAGNVGIGTTSPVAKLHVYNSAGGNATDKATMLSEAVMKLQPHTTNSTNMLFAQVDGGNSMGIQVTNGPATANWDLALSPFGGNVGIGTASPGVALEIGQNNSSTSVGYIRLRGHNTIEGNIYKDATYSIHMDTNSNNGPIRIDGSKLILGITGNVGIGTDTPNDILDIRKANSQLRLTDSDDNKFVQFSYSGGKLITRNNSTNTTVNQITLSEGGYVGIGTISPQTTIDLSGALLMRANPTQIGLGTFTSGNGMTVANGGELQFMHMWAGTMAVNDTIVFTYNAVSWKSWWFEITAASTSGYGHSHIGGYANNSLGYHDLETIHTSMWSLAASNNGQALTFTVTLNSNWIHPLIKIKFGCGGGEGVPVLSRCSLVINS